MEGEEVYVLSRAHAILSFDECENWIELWHCVYIAERLSRGENRLAIDLTKIETADEADVQILQDKEAQHIDIGSSSSQENITIIQTD